MDWLWVARFAILGASGLLAGFTVMVAVRYAIIWSRLTAVQKYTWKGLLPLHVWLVAMSYDLFLLSATVEVWTRMTLGAGPSWRIVVLIPAYVLGVVSMLAIARRRTTGRLRN